MLRVENREFSLHRDCTITSGTAYNMLLDFESFYLNKSIIGVPLSFINI